jgi:hypothetical protein
MVPAELPNARRHYRHRRPTINPEATMQRYYYGLPAAPSVAEAIIQAQLLILKAREREARNHSRARRI